MKSGCKCSKSSILLVLVGSVAVTKLSLIRVYQILEFTIFKYVWALLEFTRHSDGVSSNALVNGKLLGTPGVP